MANILKCKMCGGDIEVSQDMTVGKCLFCGSTMTLPRIDSDKKARLFNRANEYRLNNEFDKAYDAYKTITEEDEQEAEAYWGMILSEFGVEYVEDPTSGKRIPTCHRTQVQSVRSSTNFQLAIQYADSERKFIYQDEAEVLDKLQRSILSVSSKEEPYDVFICYKETDNETGERTKDSVLAQDIYQELEIKGIRTFFSRISLETHLGENYEPYIYAALKSARVMLMVSTSNENCEAIWVKNEWSRFIHFMSEDDGKVLIPVYREMTPYDFPEELSGFQAQDMGKVGAIQDLVYGIKKILGTSQTVQRDAAIDALLKDKLDREEKQEKRNKTRKKATRILAILISSVVVILAGIIFGRIAYRAYWSNTYETKHIRESGVIPDSNEYMYWTLELTEENFDSYFEFINGVPEGKRSYWYYLDSKAYDKGWIFYSSSNDLTYLSDYNLDVISVQKDEGANEFLLPRTGIGRKLPMDGMSFFWLDKEGIPLNVTFVSKNAVKNYEVYNKDGDAIRRVELKDGEILEDTYKYWDQDLLIYW